MLLHPWDVGYGTIFVYVGNTANDNRYHLLTEDHRLDKVNLLYVHTVFFNVVSRFLHQGGDILWG